MLAGSIAAILEKVVPVSTQIIVLKDNTMNSLSKIEGAAGKKILPRAPSTAVSTHAEITAFHEIIGYVVKLRRSGYLEDNTFADLIRYATATFIEAEIDRKITYVFDDKFTPDRLLRFLR